MVDDPDDEAYEVALLRGEVERAEAVLERLAAAYRANDVDPAKAVELEGLRAALDRAAVEAQLSAGRWQQHH